MVAETGCDAVMIGRAAAANPWIFAQMREYLETGSYHLPTEQDRYRLLSGYYRQILNANPPDGVGKMKQFACWFTHGVGKRQRTETHRTHGAHARGNRGECGALLRAESGRWGEPSP